MRNPSRRAARLVVAAALTLAAVPPEALGAGIEALRLGTVLGPDGEVPERSHARRLPAGVTIHATMRVDGAERFSKLTLSVLERGSDEIVWSETRPVEPFGRLAHFIIGASELEPGDYRARVTLGKSPVAQHDFSIE